MITGNLHGSRCTQTDPNIYVYKKKHIKLILRLKNKY
jgi:hypothetical protein